jgi:hypothetical protein
MTREDFHDMIEKDDFRPFVIQTKGGRCYAITDRANVWLPQAYESTACVAVPGMGISFLDIESIDAVQFEVDVAAAGRR